MVTNREKSERKVEETLFISDREHIWGFYVAIALKLIYSTGDIAAVTGRACSQVRQVGNLRSYNLYYCAFINTVKEIRVIPPAFLEMEV